MTIYELHHNGECIYTLRAGNDLGDEDVRSHALYTTRHVGTLTRRYETRVSEATVRRYPQGN